MPFAIIALDRPGSGELRAQLRQAHVDYLFARKDLILAGGAMLDEAGVAIGGLIIIDTQAWDVAEHFAAADPFRTGGVFAEVKVVPWRKSFFGFESCA